MTGPGARWGRLFCGNIGGTVRIILALLALATATASAARTDFFPQSYRQPQICDPARPDHREEVLTEYGERWYSRQLSAAREPSLSKAAGDLAKEQFRFTWLRSFHKPVTMRVETKGVSTRLIAKQLSGAGGYAPGVIQQRISRTLTADELKEWRALLKQSNFDNQPAGECIFLGNDEIAIRADGAIWLFEQVKGGDYRLVNRHSPADGPMRRLGLFMLRLTGWQFSDIY